MARTCWAVAISSSGVSVLAVCKSKKQALAWVSEHQQQAITFIVKQMPRADAVTAVRIAVYDRDNGQCVGCGTRLTFDGAHMHERQSRGKQGVISVENSELRCYDCHLGVRGSHGNRRPRFGESRR